MSTKSSPPAKTLKFRKPGHQSLIDWKDPANQAHILDWRRRTHEFGVGPEGDGAPLAEETPFATQPERLLEEEEPEAFRAQQFLEDDDFDVEELEKGQPAASPMAHED